MIKKLLVVLCLFPAPVLLTSCTPSAAKDIIRSKHAESHILARRLNDNNPNNDPSVEQLKSFVTSTAKDWESMDRLFNNWKPKSGMKSIDLEGRINE